MLMQLDNGVFASYQQCHFTPDGWRNYTIIGTEGRIENVTAGTASSSGTAGCTATRTATSSSSCPPPTGSHGGADPSIVAEFVRYVRRGRQGAHQPRRRAQQRGGRRQGRREPAQRQPPDGHPAGGQEGRGLLRERHDEVDCGLRTRLRQGYGGQVSDCGLDGARQIVLVLACPPKPWRRRVVGLRPGRCSLAASCPV